VTAKATHACQKGYCRALNDELPHIRNSGLYKAKYGTFESYLEKRSY